MVVGVQTQSKVKELQTKVETEKVEKQRVKNDSEIKKDESLFNKPVTADKSDMNQKIKIELQIQLQQDQQKQIEEKDAEIQKLTKKIRRLKNKEELNITESVFPTEQTKTEKNENKGKSITIADDNVIAYGTSGDDQIEIWGDNVTVYGNGGYDQITISGDNAKVEANGEIQIDGRYAKVKGNGQFDVAGEYNQIITDNTANLSNQFSLHGNYNDIYTDKDAQFSVYGKGNNIERTQKSIEIKELEEKISSYIVKPSSSYSNSSKSSYLVPHLTPTIYGFGNTLYLDSYVNRMFGIINRYR